jgi:hypothetical protein
MKGNSNHQPTVTNVAGKKVMVTRAMVFIATLSAFVDIAMPRLTVASR